MTNQAAAPHEFAPDTLLTRDELIAQLPAMGMTSSLRLVAVRPDGSENPARVGYSSDLKAFALTTYDDKENITSLYPLPTKTTHYNRGFGASTQVKYAENDVEPGHQVDVAKKVGQTLFKIMPPKAGL